VIDEEDHQTSREGKPASWWAAPSMIEANVNGPETVPRKMLWESPEGNVFYRSGDRDESTKTEFIPYSLDSSQTVSFLVAHIYPGRSREALLGSPCRGRNAAVYSAFPANIGVKTPLALVVPQRPAPKDSNAYDTRMG